MVRSICDPGQPAVSPAAFHACLIAGLPNCPSFPDAQTGACPDISERLLAAPGHRSHYDPGSLNSCERSCFYLEISALISPSATLDPAGVPGVRAHSW